MAPTVLNEKKNLERWGTIDGKASDRLFDFFTMDSSSEEKPKNFEKEAQLQDSNISN